MQSWLLAGYWLASYLAEDRHGHGHGPFREIASRLQVAIGTAHRIFTLFETLERCCLSLDMDDNRVVGSLMICTRYIIGMIADNPGLYSNEIARNISNATNMVDDSTVSRVLHRHGCTRKIVQVARQRCMEY